MVLAHYFPDLFTYKNERKKHKYRERKNTWTIFISYQQNSIGAEARVFWGEIINFAVCLLDYLPPPVYLPA